MRKELTEQALKLRQEANLLRDDSIALGKREREAMARRMDLAAFDLQAIALEAPPEAANDN